MRERLKELYRRVFKDSHMAKNNQMLSACERHDFVDINKVSACCTWCGEVVSRTHAEWYKLGLQHGMR